MLADDDVDDRELFTEAMTEINASIKVRAVEDGERLMNELIQMAELPDLIFLDLNMPKKNGKECLSEIQLHKELKKIPVIIYSTSISDKDINALLNKGAHCLIRKPDSYDTLKDIFKKVITNDFSSERNEEFLFNL